MSSGSSSRVTTAMTYALVACASMIVGVGALGVLGVHKATVAGESLTSDELRTAVATASLAHGVDVAYAHAQVMQGPGGRQLAGRLNARLLDHDVPRVDADLVTLERLHAGDDAAELAGIASAKGSWTALRAVLIRSGPSSASVRLSPPYERLSRQVAALSARESVDARVEAQRSSALAYRIITGVVVAVVIGLLLLVCLGRVGARMIRRVVEPARDQVEFSDTLQLAQDEPEAHELLRRHLERALPGSDVTVLNRNNSADRLEAVTALPEGSELHRTLAHAQPRSCLAVRSGRSHDETADRAALLSCGVCGPCPGSSTCTPLTVSGEVIGSVLLNRPTVYRLDERQRLREAVFQAAPVLANLRNLAIAEVRAATDSLTGLPNKRAVGDNLKRMLAQASRSLAPLSLLVLDLDLFKNLNDRYGHQVGDQALANVGAVLRGALREGDFAGRNGGEEFAVILPDTDVAGALVSAERIRAAVADISISGLDVSITASIGVACYPQHAVGPERLERFADSALYTAKRHGRNRVVVTSDDVETGFGAETRDPEAEGQPGEATAPADGRPGAGPPVRDAVSP